MIRTIKNLFYIMYILMLISFHITKPNVNEPTSKPTTPPAKEEKIDINKAEAELAQAEQKEEQDIPEDLGKRNDKVAMDVVLKNLNAFKIDPLIFKESKKSIIAGTIESLLQRGREVTEQVINNQYPSKNINVHKRRTDVNRIDYLSDIIAFAWYMYSLAEQKGQGFTGGSIVIEDPGYKLFDFLYNYVKSVNPRAQEKPTTIGGKIKRALSPTWASTNPYAYRRASSHFKEFNLPQYGIDIRDDAYPSKTTWAPEAKKWLPAGKKHFLFGRVGFGGKDLLFIKFEDWGLVGAQWLKHTVSFAKGTKAGGRREKIPDEVKKEFKKLYALVAAKNKKGSKPEFIRAMYTFAKQIPQSDPGYSAAQTFIKYLESNFDHLDIRRGNEVIITQDELPFGKK